MRGGPFPSETLFPRALTVSRRRPISRVELGGCEAHLTPKVPLSARQSEATLWPACFCDEIPPTPTQG